MSQRLRPNSLRGIVPLHHPADRKRRLRGPAACRSVLFQPEEQRTRPRRAGDLSRDRGQRAVLHAQPGEAAIENHDFVGSTLPFAYQPGAGLQLRAETFRSPSGLLQLRCDLAQLALRLQAETAQSNFLHSVCDRPDHQLTAEMRGNIGFVETAPLLAKLVDVELGEARSRLPAGILVSGGHGRHRSGAVSARASRYTDWPVASLLRVTSRPAWRRPVMAARTVCGSQPSRCPISAIDAPSGRSSMPISSARFVLARGRSTPDALAPSDGGLDCEAGGSGGGVVFSDSSMLSEAPSGA